MSKRTRIFVLFGVIAISALLYEDIHRYYLLQKINQELAALPSSAGSINAQRPFKAFDATQFQETHAWLGEKLPIVYEHNLLGNADNYHQAPDKNMIKQHLAPYQGQARLMLDIQSWLILNQHQLDPLAQQHAEWYLQVLTWAKEILPNTDLGFYGIPFNAADAIHNPNFLASYDDALRLLQPVLEASDSLYPAFDVVYDLPEQLEAILLKMLYSDKPIYPVVWHRGSGSSLLGQILPDYLLERQCQLLRKHADGVVWWSSALERWDGGEWYPAVAECFHQ